MKPSDVFDAYETASYQDAVENKPVEKVELTAKKSKPGKFVPISEDTLRKLLLEGNWPTDVKVRIVETIQQNNRLGIGEYTIDFIPGEQIKIVNGDVIKNVS